MCICMCAPAAAAACLKLASDQPRSGLKESGGRSPCALLPRQGTCTYVHTHACARNRRVTRAPARQAAHHIQGTQGGTHLTASCLGSGSREPRHAADTSSATTVRCSPEALDALGRAHVWGTGLFKGGGVRESRVGRRAVLRSLREAGRNWGRWCKLAGSNAWLCARLPYSTANDWVRLGAVCTHPVGLMCWAAHARPTHYSSATSAAQRSRRPPAHRLLTGPCLSLKPRWLGGVGPACAGTSPGRLGDSREAVRPGGPCVRTVAVPPRKEKGEGALAPFEIGRAHV